MAIRVKKGGIESAELHTENHAQIYAKRCGPIFAVGLVAGRDEWDFDAHACREAAEFFTKLAEDLESRE